MQVISKAISLMTALAAISSVPAWAGDRSLQTEWTIQEDPALLGERKLTREDYVLKQRLLPTGLVALSGDANEAGLAAGSQLIEIRSPGALVFCDPVARPQKLLGHAQPCLVDANSDGLLEGLFFTTSATKGILTIQGNRPRAPRAIVPVPYQRLDVNSFAKTLFLGLQYRGNANPAGNHVFQVNFGSDNSIGALTQRFVVEKALLPATRQPLGAQFALIEDSPTDIRVRVLKTIPVQPFAVVMTKTYTFN